MNRLQGNKILSWAGVTVLFIFGIFARVYLLYKGMDYKSIDMIVWLIPWYDYIASHGILKALGDKFTNYTPPYTYLLSIMTLMPIPKVMAIKLISVTMDFINAFMVYKIVQFQRQSKMIALGAAGIFLCLPTICINSTIWGQADAIYTGFILISLYFLLKDQPFWGMLSFSMAFAFKAQAVFIMPFLVIFLLKKRVKVLHFLLIPGVYIILSLPVILLGRNWVDVLTIYLQQGNTYQLLSARAPNLYILIPNEYYQPASWIGLIFASICLGLWILFIVKDQVLDNEKLMHLAVISVALTPFLLPKMHDRYFYPADVFSLVLAFYWTELWFLPVAYQIISGLSYIPFLFGRLTGVIPLGLAATLNAASIILLLKTQFRTRAAPSLRE
jgi:Gpi18-like mannosyltransferase